MGPCVWFLPIEPLEQRYTAQMWRWVMDDLYALADKCTAVAVRPSGNYGGQQGNISHGQFLDDFDTVAWKAGQLVSMARYFRRGDVKDGDVILLGDAWFPGVEALRFMAEMAPMRRIKIAGWHYAGVFDATDYYSRMLGEWSRGWERHAMSEVLDFICVGSEAHGRRLVTAGIPAEKILPYGLAWNPDDVRKAVPSPTTRRKDIVFPHRIAPEKGPDTFLKLSRRLREMGSEWHCAVSTCSPAQAADAVSLGFDASEVWVHKTKEDYYRWLNAAGLWFSCATQETFGYALHEAIALCVPLIAPRAQLCYRETLEPFAPQCLYVGDPVEAAIAATGMTENLVVPDAVTDGYSMSTRRFLCKLLELT